MEWVPVNMMEPLVDRPGPQIGRYRLSWLQMDLIAGLTVGLTTVPQALAYAEVAGLPVQYGLYSAFMGGFIYTVLGTSKDVTLGPTAIMSLLCASYVGGDPVRAVLLSLLCGTIQTAMALLRLDHFHSSGSTGFLLDFISFPVIKGFTCAAAVTIGFGQVKNVLGLKDIPHEFFLQVYYTFYRIPEARIGDVVLGLLCLCLLVMLTWMKSTLEPPSEQDTTLTRAAHGLVWSIATVRNALVVVAASLVAFSWNAFGSPVFTITGKTSQGLPPFRAPPLSETTPNGTVISFGELVDDFGGGLAVIPFMGLLESIAIAKAFGESLRLRSEESALGVRTGGESGGTRGERGAGRGEREGREGGDGEGEGGRRDEGEEEGEREEEERGRERERGGARREARGREAGSGRESKGYRFLRSVGSRPAGFRHTASVEGHNIYWVTISD
ncbi:unnamed protein product [Coregonus sp. 'balchen']|nr:unnamed protein product [Coregonus sp. 'balchen']